jgi:hypothetical protein
LTPELLTLVNFPGGDVLAASILAKATLAVSGSLASAPDAVADQRLLLEARLDAAAERVGAEPRAETAQWGNWGNWLNGWNNWRNG